MTENIKRRGTLKETTYSKGPEPIVDEGNPN